MNCGNLIDISFPVVQLSDTVGKAKNILRDDRSCVVLEDMQFRGLLDAEALEDIDETFPVASCLNQYTPAWVSEADFFLTAVRKMREHGVAYLPVIRISGEYAGMITRDAIVDQVAQYLGAAEPGGVIILQMLPHQFSISELGRIVESNDAKLLHLTTWTDEATGMLMVSMKVNKTDIQDILASFERYELHVYQYFGENLSEETLKSNFDNLMHYLRM
jgi:acetoin utilization protein AcuB